MEEGAVIDENSLKIFITALLAAFGALARLLNQKEKTAVRIANLISGCIVAAFSGIMANFASDYFHLDPSLTYVLAGISGWIGPQALDMIAGIILKKTGFHMEPQKDENKHAPAAHEHEGHNPPQFRYNSQ